MNDLVNGTKEAIDIGKYDAKKCFDSLWLEKCINDICDAGLKNYKFNLLYLMNKTAQVAIKTPWGLTERRTMSNIVMQGTVWGSLFCTGTMDKLGKLKQGCLFFILWGKPSPNFFSFFGRILLPWQD